MDTNNRQTTLSSPAADDGSPLDWRRIIHTAEPSALVFRGYYEEFAGAEASASEPIGDKEDVMSAHEVIVMGGGAAARQMVVQNESRLVQVNMPELQVMGVGAPNWGNDSAMIEEWFAEGETLADAQMDQEMSPERRLDKAKNWMRSMAAATGLVSS